MKVVNKKGKLFGFINVIDLIIILGIVIIGVFLASRLGNNNTTVTTSAKQKLYIVAEAYKKSPEVVEGFIVDDKIVSQNKYQDGTIDYVTITEANEIVTMADGELVAAKNPLLKDIEVGIRCLANVNGPYMDVGGQEIKVGLNYYIKTDKAEVHGTIKEIRFE